MNIKTLLLTAALAGGVYLMLRGPRPWYHDLQLSDQQREMLEAQDAAFYNSPSNAVLSK